MKAAIYVRVSTEEQVKEGFSINAQKQRLKEFVKSQGWKLYKEYVDEGFSAKNLERPAMQSMINDIKKEKFDVVLVYRLDRMVRSVLDLHELLKLFDNHNVTFKSATEMFDTTSAMGRFFITLVGAMAAWERENLAERVVMGMKRMVEEGNRAGGRAPFGYDLVNGKLEINKEEAKWVQWIFEQYKLKGAKIIAVELNQMGIRTKTNNLWHANYIKYTLENPVYYGELRWNYFSRGKKTDEEILTVGDHEPIISKEIFDNIQEVRKSRFKKGYKGHKNYIFTGILKCSRCGGKMTGSSKSNGYKFYRCTNKYAFKTCDIPSVGEQSLVDEFLNNLELTKGNVEIEDNDIDIDSIHSDLDKTMKAKDRVKNMYKWGDISSEEYRKELDKLSEKESQLSKLLDSIPTPVNVDEINDMLSKAKDNWHSFTDYQKKGFVQSLISSITVDVLEKARGNIPAKVKIVDARVS